MAGTAVPLGPFKGGMNNWSGQSTIGDDQLFLLENGEFDTDGTIVSRPAFTPEELTSPHTGVLNPLGYYTRSDGETFLVIATGTDTQAYQLSTQTWTQVWTSIAASFVQYDNKIVMCSESVAGAYWEAGTTTAVPTMPIASQIVFYQERFWLFGVKGSSSATTLWFSNLNVISPPSSIFTFDTSNNFITVSRGDGQWITGLVADTNALIIFRSASTYQFTYPNAPASGTLRSLSKTIGAENKWSYGFYENYYLVFSQGYLYQFINFRFYPLNTKKIIFSRGTLAGALLADIRVSIFGRRVVLWFYGSLYIYNLITATWSVWVSPTTSVAQLFTVPSASTTGQARSAICVTGETNAAKQRLWRISDGVITVGAGEAFTLHIITKAYELNKSAQFKRLMWWALEVLSASGAEGIAHPLTIPISGVTWNQMSATTWNQLSMGTWNNLLITQPTYDDNTVYPMAAPQQMTIKVRTAIRFLRTSFEVFLHLDGTAATSPARIYSITPYLKVKATVSGKVS